MSSSKIIRGEAAENDSGQAFHFADVYAQARAIKEDADRYAAQVRAKAQADIEKQRDALIKQGVDAGREQGRKEGFQQGRQEGHKAGYDDAFKKNAAEFQERLGTLVKALETGVRDFESHRQRLMRQAEAELLALSVEIAEKIIAREVSCDPGLVKTAMTRALELVSEKHSVEFVVNPQDLATAERFQEELKRVFQDLGTVRLHQDEEIAPGGVIVRTPKGEIDARIDQQLDRIRELLTGSASPTPNRESAAAPNTSAPIRLGLPPPVPAGKIAPERAANPD